MWRWWGWWWWGGWRRRWWRRWGSIAQCITYQYHRALRACLQQPWRKQQSSKNICNKHPHCTMYNVHVFVIINRVRFLFTLWKTRILMVMVIRMIRRLCKKTSAPYCCPSLHPTFFTFTFFKGFWWWRECWGSARVPKPESDCAKREGMRRHSGFVVRTAQWTGNSHFSTVQSTVNWAQGTVHKILFERVKHLSAH